MRVIDSHVHLYPPEVNRDPAGWARASGEEHWARLCIRQRPDGSPVQSFPSVDELLWQMDDAGVERSVLLGWYWENRDSCALQNRFFAEAVRAHPDRLSAFAAVRTDDEAACVEEVRRARNDGLIGLGELSPHSNHHTDCASPVLAALLELAGELRMPVNVHVTDPHSSRFPGRVETPWADFARLVSQHPATTFILAHWAGGGDVREYKNVAVDTAAAPLIYRTPAWDRVGRTARADQVLFGSDFPLNVYPRQQTTPQMRGFVQEAAAALTDPALRQAVLSENCRRWLNLAGA